MREDPSRRQSRSASRRSAPRPRLPARALGDEMHAYSGRDLKQLFDLPVSMLRSLVRAGHIHPQGSGRSARYSFDDLLTLKTAAALRAAKIPSRNIHRALRKLREADTGQYALPLGPAPQSPPIRPIKDSNPKDSPRDL